MRAASRPLEDEYRWQLACLPEPVRELVISGLERRFGKTSTSVTRAPRR
jgi:hypothetical protein